MEFSDTSFNINIFLVYSDAAFTDIIDFRKSSAGYIFQLYGGSIAWKASKQLMVIILNTEAELLALTDVGKEIIAWKHFLDAIKFNLEEKLNLYCDNLQMVWLLKKETPKLYTKLCHVDIYQNWLWQEMQEKRLLII